MRVVHSTKKEVHIYPRNAKYLKITREVYKKLNT